MGRTFGNMISNGCLEFSNQLLWYDIGLDKESQCIRIAADSEIIILAQKSLPEEQLYLPK